MITDTTPIQTDNSPLRGSPYRNISIGKYEKNKYKSFIDQSN